MTASKIPYIFGRHLTIEVVDATFGAIKGVVGSPPHHLTLGAYRSSEIGSEEARSVHEHEYIVDDVSPVGMLRRFMSDHVSMDSIIATESFGVIPCRFRFSGSESMERKYKEVVLFIDSMDYEDDAVFPRNLTITRALYSPNLINLHPTHRATYKVHHP